jgi:hypothetical protein
VVSSRLHKWWSDRHDVTLLHRLFFGDSLTACRATTAYLP